jgi:hypothetical protein
VRESIRACKDPLEAKRIGAKLAFDKEEWKTKGLVVMEVGLGTCLSYTRLGWTRTCFTCRMYHMPQAFSPRDPIQHLMAAMLVLFIFAVDPPGQVPAEQDASDAAAGDGAQGPGL